MGMNPKFADFASFEIAIHNGDVDRNKTKLWVSSNNCCIWEWDNETPDLYEEERQGALLVELGRPENALLQIMDWMGILAEET